MFNAVDNIIARHRIHAQPWQVSVNGDIPRTAARIAIRVGDRSVNGQIAIAQRLEIGCRNADTPA
nr:hypothetical protein [Escherichia coli]